MKKQNKKKITKQPNQKQNKILYDIYCMYCNRTANRPFY